MTKLAGKVALVTGSARGLGKAIAERLGSLGAKVVINYSSDDANAYQTVEAIKASGSDAIAIRGDVSRVMDIDSLFEGARIAYGKLDIIVANAGIELIDTPAFDFTEEQFDRLFSVNAKGAILTLQRAGRQSRTTAASSIPAPAQPSSQLPAPLSIQQARWALAS